MNWRNTEDGCRIAGLYVGLQWQGERSTEL